jgi:hypothetical protein
MNPGTVRGQAIAVCVLLSALAIIGRPLLAVAMAAVGTVWVLAMNHLYARRLGDQGRTERRAYGDRAIALQLLVAYGIPVLVGLVVYFTGASVDPAIKPFRSSEVQGLAGVLAATITAWLISSHVDWYYVRPRIDGVVIPPPCQTSRDSMWKGVTRKWYIHRTFASVTTMAAVVAVATIVTVVLAREWPNALSNVGGFTAIVAVGFWLMKDEIRSAAPTSRAIRSPRYWLGDDLSYETDMWKRRGFVLHVAIPLTKLVPLDWETGARLPDLEMREEPATLLHAARCDSRRFTPCKSARDCEGLNPECTYRQPKTAKGRRRPLIL